MRKYLFTMFLLCLTLTSQAQMNDTQVMQEVMREMQTGASQSQIATRLMQKGVTMDQLQRVRSQYETLSGGRSTRSSGATSDVLVQDSRLRDNNGAILTDTAGNVFFTQQVKATSASEIEREKIEREGREHFPGGDCDDPEVTLFT